jgi:hypothetical protein
MLNQATMLQRVGIPMGATRFMVVSRSDATRGFPSARGIEIAPDLISRLSGPTSNFSIFPSTAGREIQADNTKDSGLFGDPPQKLSTEPLSGRYNRKPKKPNPALKPTYSSVLRPLPHAG